MGTLHIFPGPAVDDPQRRYWWWEQDQDLQLVPRGAGSREWVRFGKRRGRSSWMVAMPGPRSIMNSCATALLSWVRAGYKRAASPDLAKTNDTPELLLQAPLLRQQQSIYNFVNLDDC